MRKMKLKIKVKMRKRDSFKDNSDVDYNDDDYKDIEGEGNEDWTRRCGNED